MKTLKEIINEYINSVNDGLLLFENKYNRRDILKAWHEGALPKEGELAPGIEYELHGIGCCIIYPEFDLDFDFGPNGSINGFDLWRLSKYIRQFPDRFPNFQDQNSLEAAFAELNKSGDIIQKYPTQSALYFLKDS